MRSNLKEHQIIDLIREYTSALQKLEFQANNTRQTILGLLDSLLEKRGSEEEHSQVQTSRVPKMKKSDNGNFTGIKTIEKEPRVSREEEKHEKTSPAKTVSGTRIEKNDRPVKKRRKRKKGGYRLSDWDKLILNSLEENEKVMINSDFFELGEKFAEDQGENLDESQIRGKISRSLNKLANKRGALVKLDFEGKGHAYALNSWINNSGRLKRKFDK